MSGNKAEEDLADRAGRFLKAELKRADVTYEGLAVLLNRMGLEETKASIASKIGRCSFSAVFLIATLKAIGKTTVDIEGI